MNDSGPAAALGFTHRHTITAYSPHEADSVPITIIAYQESDVKKAHATLCQIGFRDVKIETEALRK